MFRACAALAVPEMEKEPQHDFFAGGCLCLWILTFSIHPSLCKSQYFNMKCGQWIEANPICMDNLNNYVSRRMCQSKK